MPRRAGRVLAAVTGAGAALVATVPVAIAVPQDAAAAGRPAFKVPFRCGQTWVGSNWNGHSPSHSIDWNHYNSSGSPDDLGRKVLASAGGKVVASHYSTTTGYGHTIVIQHANGWQTRYAHLSTRLVGAGAQVKQGQLIGKVGKSSAKYNLTPHLHYEQIHNGSVAVSVIQGVTWKDFTKRNQTSKNGC